MRSCGSCTLCCKVLGIDEIKKPRNEWCPHCEKSKGCKIYLERPSECRNFECLWLRMEQVPEALKPQKCKVVLSAEFEGARISAYVDDTFPTAWREKPVLAYLRTLSNSKFKETKNRQVIVRVGKRAIAILPDKEIDLGDVSAESMIYYRRNALTGLIEVTVEHAAH